MSRFFVCRVYVVPIAEGFGAQVAYVVNKYRKQSMLGFFLAAMITISGLFMFALQIHDMAQDGLHFTGFRNACSSNIS